MAPALTSITFDSLQAGPRLLVLGAVHGNETCGPGGIARAIGEIEAGQLTVARGAVTFVPIVNRKAYDQRTREGDRNLNRLFGVRAIAVDNEDRIANALAPLLARHDALLDIHSFSSDGEPFVFFGPEDNTGNLEPFRHGAAELAFAAALGPELLMHGWLPAYARLLEERQRVGFAATSIDEGVGTTEFMRYAGGYGVTIECGRHDDPAGVEVAYVAIRNALAHLALTGERAPPPPPRRVLELTEMALCRTEGDRIEGHWQTGDAVKAGTVIARRADGIVIAAERDGFVVFPKPDAVPGQTLFYFAVTSTPR